MTRFFVLPDDLKSDSIVLVNDNAVHARVLRLKEGERVIVCDGSRSEALCEIKSMEQGIVTLAVLNRLQSSSEPCVRASVYMAFPKADKLEHVIQKATELGAWEIVAFPSARCVSRPDEKSLKKKLERWQKIAASAAEQSGRGSIPQVRLLNSYKLAVQEAAQADLPVLFYENEDGFAFSSAISATPGFKTSSLLIGPEGGLEEAEVQEAKEAGMYICTLGKRILRCETAPLCALSALMFAVGEF